ncbi:unnamed protein product [Camellia sinensis]
MQSLIKNSFPHRHFHYKTLLKSLSKNNFPLGQKPTMGVLGKWLKSLIGLEKTQSSHQKMWAVVVRVESGGYGGVTKQVMWLRLICLCLGLIMCSVLLWRLWLQLRPKSSWWSGKSGLRSESKPCFELFCCKTSFKGIESSSEATSDFPRQVGQEASCCNTKGGWCDSPGIAKELKAKLQMRQEGAIKRERNNCTLPISTGKWLKSLIGLKKIQSSHQENVGNTGKGRK